MAEVSGGQIRGMTIPLLMEGEGHGILFIIVIYFKIFFNC